MSRQDRPRVLDEVEDWRRASARGIHDEASLRATRLLALHHVDRLEDSRGDLDIAIELQGRVVEAAPALGGAAALLASLCEKRFVLTGSRADLHRALEGWDVAVERAAPEERELRTQARARIRELVMLPERALPTSRLAGAGALRGPAAELISAAARSARAFAESADVADLVAEIGHRDQVVRGTAYGLDPEVVVGQLGFLSRALYDLHMEQESPEPLVRADAALRRARELVRNHGLDPFETERVAAGIALTSGRSAGDVEALDRAVRTASALLDGLAEADGRRGDLESFLALALSSRFAVTRRPTDLDAAVELSRSALAAAPTPQARTTRRRELVEVLAERAEQFDSPADHDELVALVEADVEELPETDPDRVAGLCRLAEALLRRHHRLGESADLDRACLLAGSALGHSAVTGRVRAEVHLLHADALGERWDLHGRRADLDAMVAAATDATTADPDHLAAGRNLAVALLARHDALGERDDLDRAVEHLERYCGAAAADDPDRPAAVAMLANALETRARAQASAADRAAAQRVQESAEPVGDDVGHRAELLIRRFDIDGEAGTLDSAIDLLTGALQSPVRPRSRHLFLLSLITTALQRRDRVRGTRSAATLVRLRELVATLGPQDHRLPSALRSQAGLGLEALAGRTPDDDEVDEAIRLLSSALDLCAGDGADRLGIMTDLGAAFLMRHDRRLASDDLERAAALLAGAVARLDGRLWDPDAAEAFLHLADASRRLGRTEEARALGRSGLLARWHEALLATRGADAAAVGTKAASEAVLVTRWCLADGCDEEAVGSLELGRGLTLYSTMLDALTPRLLCERGRADLAERWRSPEDPDATVVPFPLRFHTMEVLLGGTDGGLTEPPTPTATAEAMRRTGVDAVVHLVPGPPGEGGHALVRGSGGELVVHPVPELTLGPGEQDGPLERYLLAYADGPGTAEWRRALHEVCAWAAAVLEPIVAAVSARAGSEIPHLVLVPVALLSLVPWHAAGEGSGPRLLDRAVVSTAPSARIFVENAARPAAALDGRGLVVGNPTGDLPFAEKEVESILPLHPQARRLGRSARPQDLLDAMPTEGRPGEPLLHLACHGTAGPSAERCVVALADDQVLTAGALLGHATRRDPAAAGPLVVLSACSSGVGLGAFDEALTVATGFLAAGASTVVSSLWPIDDRRTAALMSTFHRILVGGVEPARALREAQLWMLGRGDPRLGPPPARSHDPLWWAAFTHQGR